jgi:hypothetical protein
MIRRPLFYGLKAVAPKSKASRNLPSAFSYKYIGQHRRYGGFEILTKVVACAEGVKNLSAILIISVFLIALASFALLRTKRSSSKEDTDYLPPGISSQGLFAETATKSLEEAGREAKRNASEELEKQMLERAARGDFDVLKDARATRKDALYRQTLDTLVEHSSENGTDLRSLADFIAGNDELRSSPALAARFLEEWEKEPSRASVATLLRVAALSDDARLFERVMAKVLEAWEAKRMSDLSAGSLRSLFESEYWLLSSEAKRSGAGFQLKQALADARRRLSENARRAKPSTDADFQREVAAEKERS